MELEIACRILDGGYTTKKIQGSKNKGSPDFSIPCDNYMLHLECTCVTEGENINAVDCECEILKEKSKVGELYISGQIGSDKRKNSRFFNAICPKAKQVERHRQNGIIKENDKIVLVIATYFHTDEMIRPFSQKEFEDTIAFKSITMYYEFRAKEAVFEGVKLENIQDKCFVKNQKKITVTDKELDSFNAFVYSDSCCNFFRTFTTGEYCASYIRH